MKFSSTLLFAAVAAASPFIGGLSKLNRTDMKPFGLGPVVPGHHIPKKNETSHDLVEDVRLQLTSLKNEFTNSLSVIDSLLNDLELSANHVIEPTVNITTTGRHGNFIQTVAKGKGAKLTHTKTSAEAEATETFNASSD